MATKKTITPNTDARLNEIGRGAAAQIMALAGMLRREGKWGNIGEDVLLSSVLRIGELSGVVLTVLTDGPQHPESHPDMHLTVFGEELASHG